MTRRKALFASAAAAAFTSATAGQAAPAPAPFKLRYGPRVGWLQEPVTRQLEIYAEAGFRDF
jgi:ABC-type nitrate/sulfonate/bicarbonate transport system substrate-binding protein